MKRIDWASVVVSVVMAVAIGYLGFFGAGWMLRQHVKGAFAQWHSLGTPPEAVSFLEPDPRRTGRYDVDVYGTTLTGTTYRYVCCTQHQAAWHKVQRADGFWPGLCGGDMLNGIPPHPAFARLSAKVIACEFIIWEMETSGMTGTSYFVILEDHSVWWWRQERVSLWTVVAWLVGGPMSGAGIGVWLAFLLKRQRVRRLRLCEDE